MPEVQAEIGGDNRFVVFANETHVVGEGDSYGCASEIIQAFVTDPAALQTPRRVLRRGHPRQPRGRRVPGQPRRSRPAHARTGRTHHDRRCGCWPRPCRPAGDAVARYESVGASPDAGLYGGSVTSSASGDQLKLTDDELVPGVKISGTVTIGASTITVDLTAR